MKKYLLPLFFLLATVASAQQKTTKNNNHNMPVSTNILDMQTEVFKDIAKDSVMVGIDFSKVKNYKDIVNQTQDLTPEEKIKFKQLYELQKKELDSKKKDSIIKLMQKYIVKK